MKSWTEIFRDVRLLLPLAFFLVWEGCLQLGFYSPLLRPRSYAGNVERVVQTITNSKIDPDLLILGTSVPYQGVNLPLLNELLARDGIVVQSAATEGGILITQHTLYRKLRPRLPRLKGVLHISEITFPWTARRLIDPSNRNMIGQIDRRIAFELARRHDIHLSTQDYSALLIRSISYQQDIREFVVNPLRRLKELGKARQQAHGDYSYENQEEFRLSVYPADSLEECMRITTRGIPEKDANGRQITNDHHRQAVWRTCEVALRDPLNQSGYAQWNRLFFQQLAEIHKDVKANGHQIFTIFPPYSDLIPNLNADWRVSHWQEGLAAIAKKTDTQPLSIDLRHSLDGKNNRDYYYDTIHLNREGSLKFTEKLAEAIQEQIKPRLQSPMAEK